MSKILILLGVFSVWPMRGAAIALAARDANLEIRLLSPLDSRLSKAGSPISAVVIAPLATDLGPLAVQGATLYGTVTEVHPAGLGLKRGAAEIEAVFERMVLRNGAEIPIEARIAEIETARERVDTAGRVHGIDPAASLSSGFSFMMSTFLLHTELEAPAMVVKVLAARSPDYEISLPVGSEMFIRLTHALEIDPAHLDDSFPTPVSFPDLMAARAVLSALPSQQAEMGPHRMSDLINIVLLGTKQQVENAFRAAGWTGEAKHSALALYGMFHCLVQRQGFLMAPMSRLRLNGSLPDATYQKSLNSLAKRHHARFWDQPDQQIWLGAATEDVSLTVRHMLVTHAINPNIDDERAKIVNDLWFAGCVRQASLLQRDPLPPLQRTDGPVATDGDVAVIRLGACETSNDLPAPQRRTVGMRTRQAFAAVAMDIVRANPLTVGVTLFRTVANAIRKTNAAQIAGATPPARTSMIDAASDALVRR